MLTLAYLRPEEGQSIWPKRRQGFQPCFEAGIRELPFLMPEPAEKPSLQVFLFYLATVICATASGAYIISAPHYEDFNKMIVNCSSNGAEQMPDPLWCSFDGHDPIALPLSKTRRSGCVAATALPNSRISVVLQGCNRVELRCGNVKWKNNSALSTSVVLWSLESKELAICIKLSLAPACLNNNVNCNLIYHCLLRRLKGCGSAIRKAK